MCEYKKFLCDGALKSGFSRARVLSPFKPGDFCPGGPSALPESHRTGAEALLVAALPYGNRLRDADAGTAAPSGDPEAVPVLIALFARFNYYREAVKRMKRLSALVRSRYGGQKSDYRVLCNSPVSEKPLALACGLGAEGRNSLVINRESGSLFVIAAMTLPRPLSPDPPLAPPGGAAYGEAPPRFPLCEGCGPHGMPACVAACPTGAVLGNGRIDLERCIQWYASGHGPPEIPAPVLAVWGRRLYGCDSCQDACVHNRRAIRGVETDEGPLPSFLDARALLKFSDAEIKALFKGTAMGLSWLSPRTIRRNAEAVLQYGFRFN
ncbi:MAG: hypothetical protein LBO04_07195 [Spirochaetaceae bacterium]|jgi:epoxyqueuosine reductase|nr:hypothetical protein [Spirochaetaceae bacterium]